MTRPDKPSNGRPNCPVLTTSVGAVAGARVSRFRMLNALKKLLRNSSLAFSPSTREFGRRKFLPKDKSSCESPATGDCTNQVMVVAVEGQLVVAGNAEILADIEIRIAFVDGLGEWVGLLKTDLIRREVDGVAPGVKSRNAEALCKSMRKLGNHRVETGVYVGKRYEDPLKPIIPDHDRT